MRKITVLFYKRPSFFDFKRIQDSSGWSLFPIPDLLLCCYLWRVPGSSPASRHAAPRRGTMLGLDVCEFGGQVLELLWLTMCYRGILADKKDLYIEEEEGDRNLGYTAPVQKSLEEIQALDKDDESLVKYKQTLLGKATLLADPSVQNVQVTRLTLLCDEAPRPLTMDLTEVSDQKDKRTISIKEGVTFRLKIDFKVNREIVSGLRYHHKMFRKGIIVDKQTCMAGSFGPKEEEQEFITPVDEAANGVMNRGHYQVKSCLKDDDKNVHLSWEWSLEINKDWIE